MLGQAKQYLAMRVKEPTSSAAAGDVCICGYGLLDAGGLSSSGCLLQISSSLYRPLYVVPGPRNSRSGREIEICGWMTWPRDDDGGGSFNQSMQRDMWTGTEEGGGGWVLRRFTS